MEEEANGKAELNSLSVFLSVYSYHPADIA